MTGIYVINIGNASAKQWASFTFEKTLNGMSNAQIALDGVTGGYVSEFDVDKVIEIYKTGTLKFKGIIIDQDSLNAGGIILTALGIEHELMDEKSPMVGSLLTRAWTSTSDETILNTLITSVAGWTIDHSNSASTNVDFRTSASESVWNAAIRLISLTGKDINIDQENKVVYLYDELTRDNKFAFVEGKNAKDIRRRKSRSRAGKVIIYGKGDGQNQIIGTNGAGTPEHVIIDRNVVSVTEANARALAEYNKLNPQSLSYHFTPIIAIDNLLIGDSGDIVNNSANINETVDITRMSTTVDGNGTETVRIEVTNPSYRIASKDLSENKAINEAQNNQGQASMQGSGNTLTWERGVNAKNGTPLAIMFQIPSGYISDEAGNLRVNSFTVDYDVDPYKKGIGLATDAGHVHSISSTTTDNMSIPTSINDTSWSENINATWDSVAILNVDPGTYGFLLVTIELEADSWSGTDTVGVDIQYQSQSWLRLTGIGFDTTLDPIHMSVIIPVLAVQGATTSVTVRHYSVGTEDYQGFVEVFDMNTIHTHDISALTGTQQATADVSIGDDISDAGAINASEVDIFLDFWNGSSWVNKHSIINTGQTLDTDVDISNSGTYPDVAGLWRVRVEPDSSDPDYIQTVVKMRHHLDGG